MCAIVNKSFYLGFLQKLEPKGPRETKGVLSMSDNKYTITHKSFILLNNFAQIVFVQKTRALVLPGKLLAPKLP